MTLTLPGTAAEIPAACDLAPVPGQDATLACFQDLDQDADGALSAAEARVLPRLRGRFDELDGDGNGSLSADEFQGSVTTPPQRSGAKGA
jgi:hypothetical protein